MGMIRNLNDFVSCHHHGRRARAHEGEARQVSPRETLVKHGCRECNGDENRQFVDGDDDRCGPVFQRVIVRQPRRACCGTRRDDKGQLARGDRTHLANSPLPGHDHPRHGQHDERAYRSSQRRIDPGDTDLAQDRR